jgi:ribosome-binding factor A
MKRGFDRAQRVADLIQKTLAEILLRGMDDTRFRLVTVTGVTLSRDFSYAKVYVSVLEDDEEKIKNTIQALNRAAKSLRYELAHEIKMRVIPELKFHYDDSTAQGFRISRLIESAVNKDKK